MIVTRHASNVGMRQFARLVGEAMTSSKTSDGETKMLRSFSRTDVGETGEAGIELVVAVIFLSRVIGHFESLKQFRQYEQKTKINGILNGEPNSESDGFTHWAGRQFAGGDRCPTCWIKDQE